MPRMWTQESQLSTVLSASRWNKSTQENKSNPCINHPAYSELYITHQRALARLVLRLCWNLSRPDSLCTFNHAGFASPFQLVSIIWCLKNSLQVLSCLIQPPFPPEDKGITLLHLVHTAALFVFYTPGQYRSKRTARYPSHGQAKEDWAAQGGVCPSTTPFFHSKKYPISFLHPYAHPCTHSDRHQKQMFTFQVALKFHNYISPYRSAKLILYLPPQRGVQRQCGHTTSAQLFNVPACREAVDFTWFDDCTTNPTGHQ